MLSLFRPKGNLWQSIFIEAIFFCKREIYTIRNRIILYKNVDYKISINVSETFEVYVIPAGIYLLKVNTLVTLEQGVRTVQS